MSRIAWILALAAAIFAGTAGAQSIHRDAGEKRVTTVGVSAVGGERAEELALNDALRKAVKESCGVFLTAESKAKNYQAVYDRVFSDAVGYVKEYDVIRTWSEHGVTFVQVKALVSTQKFERNWASIAHTLEQEDNPRMVVAVVESIHQTTTGPAYQVDEAGAVQSKIESFFLEKGISLMDRATSEKVTKRDVMLAAIKDDTERVAAMGARFNADVVVVGRATAKYGKSIEVAGQKMHQYSATLNIRVVQCDSARILASKSYGPITCNTMQRGGGEDKALAKLADESAPKLLAAVAEAWRKRANVARTFDISIAGMDYSSWKTFRDAVTEVREVRGVRLREITEGIASIDIEYEAGNQDLADMLDELADPPLDIVEFNSNRLRLKVVEDAGEVGSVD